MMRYVFQTIGLKFLVKNLCRPQVDCDITLVNMNGLRLWLHMDNHGLYSHGQTTTNASNVPSVSLVSLDRHSSPSQLAAGYMLPYLYS